MRFRKLRIAWLLFWSVACILLVVLWTRSYRWQEQFVRIRSSNNRFVMLGQSYGAVFFRTGDPQITDWRRYTVLDKWYLSRIEADPYRVQKLWIKLDIRNGHRGIHLPHWIVLLACCAISSAPWLGCRFSLRTLLIATTLVAVVLGLAVWAASK